MTRRLSLLLMTCAVFSTAGLAAVEFRVLPLPFTAEEQAEFDGWEKLGDEAWAMIDWGEGEIARDSG